MPNNADTIPTNPLATKTEASEAVFVAFGAEPLPLAAPLATELAGTVGVGAEPEGKSNPTMLPVRGPGRSEAAAPEPLRAPEGVGGEVPFRALAAFWNNEKVLPVVGALMTLVDRK